MGVEGEFAWAGLLEGAEESAVFFMERRGRNVACANGGFDTRIVVGITDANDEIAGVELNVLAAGDVFDGDVAGGDAGIEFGVSRDANFEIDVVARASAYMKFGVATGTSEAVAEVVDFVLVLSGDVHAEFSVLGADNADIARAEMQGDPGAGRDSGFKMGDATFGDIGFVFACGRGERY